MRNLTWGLIILVLAIIAGVYLFNNFDKITGTNFFNKKIGKVDGNDKAPGLALYNSDIRISGVAPGGQFLGSPAGWVSIMNGGDKRVNVTGWRVEANRGSFTLPRAIEIYHPSGLSPEADIVLWPGDVLYIYTHASPIGKNLMINKCLGFLENSNIFDPPLPRLCPTIDRYEIIQLSGECQNYLLSLSRCQLPDPNTLLENDPACAQKIREINYRGCFDKYGNDDDFLTGEWRVWGSGALLDPSHDILRLVNRDGLIVDDYVY